MDQIEFDATLEEEKPFLKNLFDSINAKLEKGTVITEVKHFPWRERYTFEKNVSFCVIDFEYDKAGFLEELYQLKNIQIVQNY